jgi:hypothetical protein
MDLAEGKARHEGIKALAADLAQHAPLNAVTVNYWADRTSFSRQSVRKALIQRGLKQTSFVELAEANNIPGTLAWFWGEVDTSQALDMMTAHFRGSAVELPLDPRRYEQIVRQKTSIHRSEQRWGYRAANTVPEGGLCAHGCDGGFVQAGPSFFLPRGEPGFDTSYEMPDGPLVIPLACSSYCFPFWDEVGPPPDAPPELLAEFGPGYQDMGDHYSMLVITPHEGSTTWTLEKTTHEEIVRLSGVVAR